ncbi:MAG: hypothetical protein QF805_11130, partial [Pirellulaceae bacterium]|nr:hypothetical protein [Pirellulaceae bacterium]
MIAFAAGSVVAQDDPFRAIIRPTEPLNPSEELATFRLPDGFSIDLVASEPEIAKPMNVAFDAHGRLWVTVTQEYPHPAKGQGRDAVVVFSDEDGDGQFEKNHVFADGLNIPIGLLPYDDGCIVFSIPHIWRLRDTDGDGSADERIKLYGPMGFERDTHGLNNSFRRGLDGWIYACHGFNNETTVQGADGHTVHMQSGNTYRLRPDGSRIEQYSWGQVNPFGMAIDSQGDIFTADCHSKPIYQLIREGYYPSFGKPHDGLGFVPAMMEHLHGSTAIAGVEFYEASAFPAQYRDNFFSGNVMTSRINRNTRVAAGSTYKAREQSDFLISSDPWFRPVDVTMGPSGALYVADFYNRIIGHYEVDLDHPQRDRKRGRLWRISHKRASAAETTFRSIADAGVEQLIEELGRANRARRNLATDRLSDHVGAAAIGPCRAAIANSDSATTRMHCLWVLFRLDALDQGSLRRCLDDTESLVRIHATKALGETSVWNSEHRALAIAGLADDNPFVRRAAADGIARHPAPSQVQPLLSALSGVGEGDALLRQAIRIALRNHFRDSRLLGRIATSEMDAERIETIASICLAVDNTAS